MSKGGSMLHKKMKTKTKKRDYFAKLSALLAEYPKALIVDADNVGSRELQQVRRELRGKGVLLMGKNVRASLSGSRVCVCV
jgi:large subunit ribosomal protein LP0